MIASRRAFSARRRAVISFVRQVSAFAASSASQLTSLRVDNLLLFLFNLLRLGLLFLPSDVPSESASASTANGFQTETHFLGASPSSP